MDFRVANAVPHTNSFKSCAVLIPSNWDDWFLFETTFSLYVFDEGGQRFEPGLLKIGERGLKGKNREPGERLAGFRYPSVPAFSPLRCRNTCSRWDIAKSHLFADRRGCPTALLDGRVCGRVPHPMDWKSINA